MIEDSDTIVDWLVYTTCAILMVGIWWRILSDWLRERFNP